MSPRGTKDGMQIYDKDWSTGSPVVFSHSWFLSSNRWEETRGPRAASRIGPRPPHRLMRLSPAPQCHGHERHLFFFVIFSSTSFAPLA